MGQAGRLLMLRRLRVGTFDKFGEKIRQDPTNHINWPTLQIADVQIVFLSLLQVVVLY